MSDKTGPYWDRIRELVDAAPPLTAEQAWKIRAVLSWPSGDTAPPPP